MTVKSKIVSLMKLYNITNYYFKYCKKIFGNIELSFNYQGKDFNFVIDRGEINFNNKTIKSSDYLNNGITSIDMLISIISDILNND